MREDPSDSSAPSRRRLLKMLGGIPGAALLSGAVGAVSACSDSTRERLDGRSGSGADGGPDGSSGADGAHGSDAIAPDGGDGHGTGDTSPTSDADAGDADGPAPRDGASGSADADGGTRDADGSDAGDAEACEPTTSDVEGPFYESGAPMRTQLATEDEPGERLTIEGRVLGPDCQTPLADALVDVWHADADGEYRDGTGPGSLRGRMRTDAEGRYGFDTVKPGRYEAVGGLRPAHIHFKVSKPGHASLTTQLYFEGDPQLAPNDPCGGCNSDEPGRIIPLEPAEGEGTLQGSFDVVLAQGYGGG